MEVPRCRQAVIFASSGVLNPGINSPKAESLGLAEIFARRELEYPAFTKTRALARPGWPGARLQR
jgi:hypothetical protein